MNTKSVKKIRSLREADDQCRKAVQLVNANQFQAALDIFELVLEKQPQHRLAKRSQPVTLFLMGRKIEAARLFHQLHEQEPEDLVTLKHCGVCYTEIGNFELAIKFLSRYVKSEPNDFEAWTSLCSAAAKSQKHVEAMMYATKALSLEPTNPDAYNNLGATLLGVRKRDEAEQAFQTALILDPKNIDSLSNLATLMGQRGDHEGAIKAFSTIIESFDTNTLFAKEVLYRSSFSYLATGQLAEGWRRYDYGFLPSDIGSRTPKRQFSVPQWQGEPLDDQRLLIWGEQGLGDELWFFSLLGEALALSKHVVVECEPRLVSLMSRSFPNIKFRATNLNPMMSFVQQDFDVHIPAGSLMALFRNNIEDLKKFKAFIKPCPALVEDFAERLDQFKGKKLLGLCWRSGKLDINRNQQYLSIDELEPVLKLEDCVFVNLQYGDCENELSRVEQQFGISIVRWDDVDLKNNQEQLAAIISCLDAVVSAGTAVAQLAIASGKKTVLFGHKGWTFLGQDQYPWATCVHSVYPTAGEPLSSVVNQIVVEIDRNIQIER
jgi:tetratricopeptide (TPR) repeat protein